MEDEEAVRMRPHYAQSVEIHRGTYGDDGRLVFDGIPVDTVSGSVYKRRLKELVVAGEVINVTAQGFLAAGSDVHVADQLLLAAPATVSGIRFEVLQVISGADHLGEITHVGVELRDTVAA